MTFGPEEMGRLRDIVMNAAFTLREGGSYEFVSNFRDRYIADLTDRPKLKRRLKVVAACGNGTAGAFAPQMLEMIGCEVIRSTPARPYIPALQPQPRRHEDAARDRRQGARNRRRCWFGF